MSLNHVRLKDFKPETDLPESDDMYEVERRKQYIDYLLSNGIIRYKENSESIYYDLSGLDDKKYFELEDLEKNVYINDLISVYMINSKKGIGKTYQLRKRMKLAEDENKKFGFIRRLEDDMVEQRNDWDDLANDTDWPYILRGGRILRKDSGKAVGTAAIVSKLYNQTGKEFHGYKYLFFDEYKDKRGIKRYLNKEFNKFVKFLADFQRSKDDIKVYMFTNDETRYDPYTEGLRIDPKTDYFIDLLAGVFYVNLEDKFKGAITQNSVAARFGRYDEELQDELANNTTVYQDDANMLSYKDGTIKEVRYQFYLNKRLYQLGYTDTNKVVIKSILDSKRDFNKITYAMTSVDYASSARTVRPANTESLVRSWFNMLSHNLLGFVNYDDKLEIEKFIPRVLGLIKRQN